MYKIPFLIIILTFFSSNCDQKIHAPLTAELVVVSQQDHKTIQIRTTGSGKSKAEAISNAEHSAFTTIFFRGIPDTSVERPIIGSNEIELLSKHKAYFDIFFKERYRSFILSSDISSPYKKRKRIYTGVSTIKINLLSLKRDLEDHKIIRKFGF